MDWIRSCTCPDAQEGIDRTSELGSSVMSITHVTLSNKQLSIFNLSLDLVMSVETAEHAFSIILWALTVCLIMPLEIYWFRSFWIHRHKLLILKRRPIMLLVQLSAYWTFALLHSTFMVLSYCSGEHDYSIWMVWISETISVFIVHPIGLCVVGIMMARLWLLFFSYNLH